jgi:hypothetical protein
MIKKIIIGIAVFFFVVVIIAVIAGGDKNTQPQKVGETNTNPQSNTTINIPTTQQEKTYKVGDQVQLGKIILTVNKVETSESGQYTKPAEGNQWVDLNITIQNTGNAQEYITTLGQMFILDDADNQYQIAATDKRIENAGSVGLDGAVLAGAKKTDWVGFEVPKTAKGLKFQYNASFFNNNNILVDLGM